MEHNRFAIALLTFILCLPGAYAADTLYDERFKRWTEEAESGDAIAQYNLGNAFVRGIEVSRDYGRAAEWFAKAAAQNDAKAQYKLGYLYFEGKGVAQNYTKAHDLLRKSAQQEYSPAQYYLGRLYSEGLGVDRDYPKAVYWLTQAANDNYSPAKEELVRVQALLAAEQQEEAARRALAAASVQDPEPPVQAPAKQVQKVSPPPPAAPAPPKRQPPNHKELFLSGNWLNEGGTPSKHMPSELTECSAEDEWVICKTERLRRANVFARIDYMVEAKFGRFNQNGEFMGSYRENVLLVLPEDPDNPNPSEEDVPSTGWKVRTVIKCKFEDKRTLDCVNDNFRREHFARK